MIKMIRPYIYSYARNDRPVLCLIHSVISIQDWSRTNKALLIMVSREVEWSRALVMDSAADCLV